MMWPLCTHKLLSLWFVFIQLKSSRAQFCPRRNKNKSFRKAYVSPVFVFNTARNGAFCAIFVSKITYKFVLYGEMKRIMSGLLTSKFKAFLFRFHPCLHSSELFSFSGWKPHALRLANIELWDENDSHFFASAINRDVRYLSCCQFECSQYLCNGI